MWLLQAEVHQRQLPGETHEDAYWGATSQVRGLLEDLCPEVFTDELHYIQLIFKAGGVSGQP